MERMWSRRGHETDRERGRDRKSWHGLVSLQPECQLRNMAAVPGTAHFDFDSEKHTQTYISYTDIIMFHKLKANFVFLTKEKQVSVFPSTTFMGIRGWDITV